jgi:hypothetical protein
VRSATTLYKTSAASEKDNINSRGLPSKNSISSCISNKLEADGRT